MVTVEERLDYAEGRLRKIEELLVGMERVKSSWCERTVLEVPPMYRRKSPDKGTVK